MDDLSAKLTQLLSQPDAAEKLSQAAQSLLGGSLPLDQNAPTQVGADGLLGDIDMGALLSALSAFRAGGDDNRAALLMALRPHLSAQRQERVDAAVKLLKLAQLLPLLKAQGLLNL